MFIYDDVEHGERRVAIWGEDRQKTEAAVDLFISSGRLDQYLDAIWGQERSRTARP